ncbi:translation initiation factor IF-3 [bacterium]|nr:translation initiation factor IF-3 [bacterium]
MIDQNGEKRGVIPIQEALVIAQEAGLDLVEVAGNANPPVCKVLDYGKLSYQSKKKKQVSAKGKTELKEISFSMKISDHDIETKMKKARQLVEKGHKLRFNLILRGRERAYADTKGLEQLDKLTARIADICVVEQKSKGMIGNRLYAILSPLKKATP